MRKLSKEEVLSQVQKKSYEYEVEYHGCAQCVLLAVQDVFGLGNEVAFKAATGFAAGIGLMGSVCGALIGGVMALGLKHGRDYRTFLNYDPERVRWKSYKLAMELYKKFQETYGSCICHDIQKKILGKSYNLWDPKQLEEFEKAGGHGPQGCPTVVRNAAKWVAEILLEE